MSENESKTAIMPHTVADLESVAHIPTTEGTESFGKFMNEHIKADNWTPVTPEQAWALIAAHRVWQSSDERKAEKELLKAAKAQESAAKAEAREEAKAERDRKAAEKAADKERKAAEKAAKDSAKEDSDEDLDVADETGEGEGEIPKTTRRRRKPRTSDTEAGESADEI